MNKQFANLLPVCDDTNINFVTYVGWFSWIGISGSLALMMAFVKPLQQPAPFSEKVGPDISMI
jgi:hypothetical protein